MVRRVLSSLAVVTALLTVMIPAPAGAVVTIAPNHPQVATAEHAFKVSEARLPADAFRVVERDGTPSVTSPHHRPAALLQAAFTPAARALDAQAYVELAQDAIAAFHGGPVVDSSEAVELASAGGAGGTIRVGGPGGDLTGDGRDDALSLEILIGEDLLPVSRAVQGLRGTDGSRLWTRSLVGDPYWTAAMPAGDLAGDGTDDVILWELLVDAIDGTGGCVPLACAGSDSIEFRWRVTAVSGSDGTDLWGRTFAGSAELVGAGVGALIAGAYAVVLDVRNTLVLPLLSGDHDGDGGVDVVFDGWDVRGAAGGEWAFGAVAAGAVYEEAVVWTTRAEIVSGATGDGLFTRSVVERPGEAMLVPSGDAVGGTTSDVIWEESTTVAPLVACAFAIAGGACVGRQQSMRLEMIDGSTLTAAWDREFGGVGRSWVFAEPMLSDLTGDGRHDLLLLDAPVAPSPLSQGVLSGADGSLAWSRQTDTYLQPVGSVGGGPGDDLIGWRHEQDLDHAGDRAVVIERIDGATGAELLTTTHAFEQGESGWFFAYLMGDADADGALDPLIESTSFGAGPSSSSVVVESGASGVQIFEDTTNASFLVSTAVPAGNQDDAGGDDIVLLHDVFDFAAETVDLEMRAIRLPAGTEAWRRTERAEFFPSFALLSTGSQDGVPGSDGVFTRIHQSGNGSFLSRVEGIDGHTGLSRWAWGDAIPPPPPPATGAIAGTLTDAASEPISDVCVTAYDGNGFMTGEDLSAPDGAYTVGGLPTAEYRIEFWDCTATGRTFEWFDDKPDFASANPIAVIDGQTTVGIDAVLEGFGSGDFGSGTTEAGNQVDCGESRGDETVWADDIGGTGLTARVGGSSVGDGYAVVCNDTGGAPEGRIIGQGSAYDGDGALCADGDGTNPWPFTAWFCIMSDRNDDGVTDVGCQGAGDSSNATDPRNTAEPQSCTGGLAGAA